MGYFATDEDREGEAISWHLYNLLDLPAKKERRIVFHEITKQAITNALDNPRKLDNNLVDAQQARRVLDRLVGYKLSPLLWKKIARGLSAGRVQSVAVRLIVEREEEIRAFKPEEYWTVEGEAQKGDAEAFELSLHKENNKPLGKFDIDESKAKQAVKDIEPATLLVSNIKARENKKTPLPPFMTSTLQQDAHRRFGYSAKQIMMLAQQLYEGIKLGDKGNHGLITYMRTDSLNLSQDFVDNTITYVTDKFGKEYINEGGRVFKKKSKLSQEAHEAIRPTDVTNDPESVKEFLDSKQFKLYSLIWQRAVASQMSEYITETTSVGIEAKDTNWLLKAVGSVIKFDGWHKVYKTNAQENELPELKEGDELNLKKLESLQHFTKPPARYSEAGLVKAMESLGIGRPSTYAPTIATVVDRQYVTKEEKRLAPTEMGEIVNKLLVEHFHDIVSYNFTAQMEDDLDSIAHGKKEWRPVISEFYKPFAKNLEKKEKELDKKKLTEEKTDEVCEKCSNPMIIKLGRFGKFLACSDYPKCKTTKNIDKGTGVKCPKCSEGEMEVKRSKRGRMFYGCNKYPDCEHLTWSKPTGEYCPDCKQLLVQANKTTVKCESCDFSKKVDPADLTED